MAGHSASPNSETTERVSPASKNGTASYPGTRYGKGGNHPGDGDHSTERIVTAR
jgi:hypothetical protein